MRELTEKDILQRIDMMDRWMKKFRDQDDAASKRYRDVNALASASGGGDGQLDDDGFDPEGGNVATYTPTGQPNWLTINIATKLAAIAMGDPDLHVKAQEDPEQPGGVPNAAQIVAKAWKQSWINGNWKRETNAGLQKRYVAGLGAIAYRWDDEYGPCIEHVPSWQLLVDPHVTNWQRLEMGGRKIKMSLRRALELYDPNGENEYFTSLDAIESDDGKNLDKEVVTIKIYWDKQEEVHAYNEKVVLRDKNLYGRVPLIIIEGDLDPTDNVFPLSDSIMAAGLQQALTDLTTMCLNSARHGGPITTYDVNMFDKGGIEALQGGKQQGLVPIKQNNVQTPAIVRYPGEQLSPAWGEARHDMQYALDGVTGVTPADRGEQIPNVTATQSVMTESKQGARPTQARADYEAWMNRIASAYIEMMQKFGGPTDEDPGTEEQNQLYLAFKAVYEVKVVEGSTTYKDPSTDQQQCMQLFTTVVQSYELFMSLAGMGLVKEIPNLKQFADDMLRAFSRQNIEQYWTQAPQPQENSGPDPELIKALSVIYKDAALDTRQQIEEDFGLKPSDMMPPEEGGDAPEDPQVAAQEQQHEERMQKNDHTHEAALQALDNHHEMRIEQMKQQHAAQLKVAEMGHQQRMGAMQAKTQGDLADKNNKAKVQQVKAKPKPASGSK